MTMAEILEQAKTLSVQERKELVKYLVDTLDVTPAQPAAASAAHWGQTLNQLFDTLHPIEMKYPEIGDPVAWVEHLRAEHRRQRMNP